MPRPIKTGLDYFPLDCHMDNKVEALEAEHKLIGFAVYIKLLQELYKTENGELMLEGQFSMWKILGKRLELDENLIRQLIEYMVSINLFDNEAFKNGILTSSGVKKRIAEIKKARRKDRKRKFSKFSKSYPKDNPWKRGESKVKEIKLLYIQHFDSLWLKYPKRIGKHDAIRHYNKTVKSDEDLKNIKTALDNYINYITQNNTEVQYIKNGSTWFHNWQDWITPPVQAPQPARRIIA